ncbi:hypothetical protein C8Q76DRAFT_855169 [Earliella scabrosa]|nr:hypothetical protein C8Q76DRAFT_855169 [Earliella scabrosa]
MNSQNAGATARAKRPSSEYKNAISPPNRHTLSSHPFDRQPTSPTTTPRRTRSMPKAPTRSRGPAKKSRKTGWHLFFSAFCAKFKKDIASVSPGRSLPPPGVLSTYISHAWKASGPEMQAEFSAMARARNEAQEHDGDTLPSTGRGKAARKRVAPPPCGDDDDTMGPESEDEDEEVQPRLVIKLPAARRVVEVEETRHEALSSPLTEPNSPEDVEHSQPSTSRSQAGPAGQPVGMSTVDATIATLFSPSPKLPSSAPFDATSDDTNLTLALPQSDLPDPTYLVASSSKRHREPKDLEPSGSGGDQQTGSSSRGYIQRLPVTAEGSRKRPRLE